MPLFVTPAFLPVEAVARRFNVVFRCLQVQITTLRSILRKARAPKRDCVHMAVTPTSLFGFVKRFMHHADWLTWPWHVAGVTVPQRGVLGNHVLPTNSKKRCRSWAQSKQKTH